MLHSIRVTSFIIITLLFLSACTTTKSEPTAVNTSTVTSMPEDGTPTVPPATKEPETVIPTIQSFEAQLRQALDERDFAQMQALMNDAFMIAPWRSEGTAYTPGQAVEQLQNNYLGLDTTLVFDPDRDLTAMLDGMDPLSILGPDVMEPSALFVSGWGMNGNDEAILYLAHRSDGSLYWYGVLFSSSDGFAPATTPTEPTASLESEDPVDTKLLDSWSSLAPDGKWRARGEALIPAEGAEQYHVDLQIERLGGDVVWSVLDEWSSFGLGYTLPTPVRWSDDGHYFYYTNRPVADGCAPFANGSDLQRVDLLDGSTTELVPSVGMSLGLSPDAGTLAYFGYGGRGLVLRDIASEEERETGFLPANNAAAGAIVWSPDGSALAFTVIYDACGPPEGRTHSILRMEAETGETTTLLESSPNLYTTEEWTEAGQVWLVDQEGQNWSMDPSTGNVTPAQ